MFIKAAKPWKPNTASPWPSFHTHRESYYSGSWHVIKDYDDTNAFFHSGGYDVIVKPTKVRHRIKGAWMARPYTRRVVNQPIVRSHVKRDVEDGPNATWREDTGCLGVTWSSSDWLNHLQPSGVHSSRLSNLRKRAEVECLLRLNSGELNAGVALAESRQTAAMLAEASVKLLKAARSASKGKWTDAASALGVSRRGVSGRGVSAKWLALQYGWLPLMGDIFGLAAELQKGLLKRHQTLSATRKVSDSTSTVGGAARSGFTDWPTFDWSLGVTVNIVARVEDPFLAKLASLGLINPLSIAWEKVPFSFVFDWFLPVGNLLNALTATAGLTFFTGSCTYRVFGKTKGGWPTDISSVPSRNKIVDIGDANAEGLMIDRQVYTSFPIPMPYVNTSPFSSRRLLNAMALLRQHAR